MFSSFFLAGFECATGFNRKGEWIDQVAATRHDRQIDEDYRLLREVGIHAAREGVRWPLVQTRSQFNFSSVDLILKAARKHRIEIIYDLFHFGYPPGIDLFSREFPEQFADYCSRVAAHIASNSEGPFYFTPINEPSYFAWAAGDAGLFAPYLTGRGGEMKIRLVMAIIQAIRAIRVICPTARFINVDPLCRVVAPFDRPDQEESAAAFNRNVVFQSWDMLAGRLHPELGGSLDILDIVGVNYYWTNQWILNDPAKPLDEKDPRYCRLSNLLMTVADRYPNDIVLSETGHTGPNRESWLNCLTEEVEALIHLGAPLRGICLYPILGMPEWHERSVWTHMGLWDLVRVDGHMARVCHEPMLRSLKEAQQRLESNRGKW